MYRIMSETMMGKEGDRRQEITGRESRRHMRGGEGKG